MLSTKASTSLLFFMFPSIIRASPSCSSMFSSIHFETSFFPFVQFVYSLLSLRVTSKNFLKRSWADSLRSTEIASASLYIFMSS